MTMMKSRSYSQHQLKILCDKLSDNIEDILNYFHLEYRITSKMVIMKCPIHGGDNPSACNIYHQGEQYRGNWICRTHNCQKFFKNSIIGFIRGILSHKKFDWESPEDKSVSFKEALEVAIELANFDLSSIKLDSAQHNKNTFSHIMKNLTTPAYQPETKVDASFVKKALSIPSDYFIKRGYSSDILKKYDVGICENPTKEMYQRSVAPIYDIDHKYMIGCTGRSIFEQCGLCKKYHDENQTCPSEYEAWKYSKWKHSNGFKADNTLYNFWFAKDHILKNGIAIIVESPGNVWRLEEAGFHNSIAIFGSSLSDKQKSAIDGSGAMHLILLTDNDDAGHKAAEQITQKCERTYKLYRPKFDGNDIGEMSMEQIKNILNPIIESIIS